MPTPFLAYVPYAAVGYCIAKVADDVWPTLRGTITTTSRVGTRHGGDGRAFGQRLPADFCPPGLARNQAMVAEVLTERYCFDETTGTIEGTGPYAGAQPPPGTISHRQVNGERYVDINVGGDNYLTMPSCPTEMVMAYLETVEEPPPPEYQPPPGEPPRETPPPGVTEPPGCPPTQREPCPEGWDGAWPGYPSWCAPRRGAPQCRPHFRRGDCKNSIWRRNPDPGRLARKRMRWG